MRKISAVVLVLVMLFSVLCLAGCGEKKSITPEDFRTITEAKGCTVVDISDQYAEVKEISGAYVALIGEGEYQVEFYVLTTDEAAKRMYAGNKGIFENSIVGASSHSSASLANYDSYKLTADGSYKVLSRIDNTMIYVDAPSEYKSEINSILKALGY